MTTYQDDFKRRYGRFFKNESWWEMLQALYEGPGHDWEGADTALDQVLYDLAKARNLDTTQVCPTCLQIVDEARSLELPDPRTTNPDAVLWKGCAACRKRDAEMDAEDAQLQEMERQERKTRYEAMSPAEKKIEDNANRYMLDGLLKRTVQ